MKKILFASALLSSLLFVGSCRNSSPKDGKSGSDEEAEEEVIDMNWFEDSSDEDAGTAEEDEMEEDDGNSSEEEDFEEGPLTYSDVDTKPSFESKSDTTFRDWVAKRVKYPEKAAGSGKSGTVMAQFTVDTLGKVSNIKIIRSVDPALDSEVIRVLASSPDWKAASHEDSLVEVSYIIPVKFTSPEKKSPHPKKILK